MITRDEGDPHRNYRLSAIFVFVASGCSGLIYQSTWTQYLGLYLGHAAYAQCLVLAIFMGGLGFGAWLTSRRSSRWRNLVFAYAVVELVIGAMGIIFHPLYLFVTRVAYDYLLPAAGPDIGTAIKWVTGALLIAPQSVLLGMTFPLMSNGLIRITRTSPGQTISVLYFANSFGAAVGAIVSTFVLLPWIGLPGAMRFGGFIGLGVALLAFVLSRAENPVPDGEPPKLAAGAYIEPRFASGLLLSASFITGATSFVYELVWVRMLSLLFGTTVHSFELMLTAFIGGLALGGWAIKKHIDRLGNLYRVAAYVQIAMGLAALATMCFYGQAFHWVAFLMRALARNDQGYVLFNIATASVAVLIMCPAAFFAGMTLPIFSLQLSRSGHGETAIGRIYAANTFGAIVGVVLTIACLVPILGLKLSMTAAALGDIVLGVVLFRSVMDAAPQRYLAILAASGILSVALILLSPFDRRELASGVYRTASERIPEDATIRFYRDGSTASVSVGERRGIRQVATNGKSDSAIQMIAGQTPTPDESTMTLAGILPFAYFPEAETIAVIGIGTGMTSNTVLGFPTAKTVDTIEIEPAMVAAAKQFEFFSARVFSDPRSHIQLEDARVFFAERNAPYDVIISEPSNPWVTGVAGLFTEEFYRHVTTHLVENGIFVQWIQQYEINDELVATICNALSEHFADYRLYLANDSDLLIVATPRKPLNTVNPNIFDIEATRKALERISIRSTSDLALHEVGRKIDFERLLSTQSLRINSDFHPILSLDAPRARFANNSAIALDSLLNSDLPLLEMLQKKESLRSTDISIDPNFTRSLDVEAAREFIRKWNDGAYVPSLLDDHSIATISALKRYEETCEPSADPKTVVTWMQETAAATLPYLSSIELAIFRSTNQIKHCNSQPSIITRFGLLVDSIMDRDATAMATRADDVLRSDIGDLAPVVADYVLRASMLGHAVSGQADDSVAKALAKQIPVPDSKVTERTYLETLAAPVSR